MYFEHEVHWVKPHFPVFNRVSRGFRFQCQIKNITQKIYITRKREKILTTNKRRKIFNW